MGHATRTLPLIEHAAQEGWHVHVASKGTALAWLESHAKGLDQVTFHHKPGPNITYAKRGNFWSKSPAKCQRLWPTSNANGNGPQRS